MLCFPFRKKYPKAWSLLHRSYGWGWIRAMNINTAANSLDKQGLTTLIMKEKLWEGRSWCLSALGAQLIQFLTVLRNFSHPGSQLSFCSCSKPFSFLLELSLLRLPFICLCPFSLVLKQRKYFIPLLFKYFFSLVFFFSSCEVGLQGQMGPVKSFRWDRLFLSPGLYHCGSIVLDGFELMVFLP